LGVALLANTAFVIILYKELQIVSFDAALATTMGLSASAVHYLLMTMVAATSVASFEAVGSILVVSMLVTPPATAYLLTDRLGRMLPLAAMIAALCAVLGTLLAIALNVTIAGMIAVVAGILFLLAAAFAPAHGVLAKAMRRASLSVRIAREDLLGELYRAEERRVPAALASLHIGQSPWIVALAERSARRRGLAVLVSEPSSLSPGSAPPPVDEVPVPGTWRLTEAGRDVARSIVRSHRLWESYLATHTTLPLDHLHEPSHRVEHFLGPELQGELAQELAPARDPHGAAIPPVSHASPSPSEPH
jgi:manganese/zinc/iron transport system permease protein